MIEQNVIDNPIEVIVEKNGLALAKAQAIINAFTPLVHEAGELVRAAEAISVTDATQVTEIKAASAARLALKKVRVRVDKARKELKEESLRTGQTIQDAANWITERIEPAEARMEELEKFAERAEKARKVALASSRRILLAPFGTDTTFVDLENMPEASFAQLHESSRLAHEAKVAAVAKAEADRLAAEKARAEEEARIRAENERLKLEQEAQNRAHKIEQEKAAAEARAAAEKARIEREKVEAAARAEKAKADAALKAERAAREALESKARDEAKAAADKAAAEARAAKKAAMAPDAEKFRAYAKSIRDLPHPTFKTTEAQVEFTKAWMGIGDGIQAILEAGRKLE